MRVTIYLFINQRELLEEHNDDEIDSQKGQESYNNSREI